MSEERLRRRLAAILAADVVGYSRLMGTDERWTLAALRAVREEVFDPAVAAHHGRLFKTMGDGMLVEFGSAVDAVSCALAVQKSLAERHAADAGDKRIALRIGVNLGDVVIEGEDVYGDGVNVAARLEGLAEPGGVLISAAVYDQVRNKLETGFEDLGDKTVKNIARPVRVYRATAEAAGRPDAPAAPADKPSVAVLAFNNMSNDPEQEYFSDGIAEDIITDLSKLAGLHVIARNSSFVYKGASVDIPKVGRELGVRHVLEGSVRKAGNRVRVTAQLIDARTGGHVWAERYDRSLEDIFAVQDEITGEIVAALKPRLTADERKRLGHRGTDDLEAYDLFLRGREHMWLHTRAGNAEARALLGAAIARAPRFAAAHAIVAFTHVIDYVNGWGEDFRTPLDKGLALAEEAVAMDDEEPYAHFALGVACLWNREHDRSIAEARRCLALEPNSIEGKTTLAHTLIFAGQAREAIRELESAMRLDPHYPDLMLHFLGQAYFRLGDDEAAAESLRRRLARNPDSETSRVLLASAYGHLGRVDDARREFAEALRINPEYTVDHRRHVLPHKDPADFDRFAEGLAKAGLPG